MRGGDNKMRTEMTEFLGGGNAVPFALRYAERVVGSPVSGRYDEISQQWVGANIMSSATLTLTASTDGADNDRD